MRFPSKQSLVRVSLLFIFAFPTLAVAEDPKTSTPRDLSLSEATTAFGPDFLVKDVGGIYTLFGVSSASCFQAEHFKITPDAPAGTFRIGYDGKDDSCLSYDTQSKSNAILVSLSDQDGAKFTPSKSFAAVTLVSKRISEIDNDPQTIPSDRKGDDGKAAPLSYTSAADLEAQKKQAAADKHQDELDTKMKVVTTCHKGFDELDVASLALDNLVKDVDFAAKNKTWIADQTSEIEGYVFRACAKTLRKTKVKDLADAEGFLDAGDDVDSSADPFADTFEADLKVKDSDSDADLKLKKANCGERLNTLMATNSKYARKVIALYFSLAKRYASAAANGTMSFDDAEAAIAKIYARIEDSIGDLKDDKLEAKATERLKEEKKASAFALLQAASAGSVDPKTYAKMRESLLGVLMDQDEKACFLDQDSISPTTGLATPLPNQAKAFTKDCQKSYELMKTVLAQDNTAKANQTAFASQMLTNSCLNSRTVAAMNHAEMSDQDKSMCTTVLARYDADAKIAANAGLNANGFGSVSSDAKTTPANTATTNPANGGSALMNTVYTSQSSPQQTVTIPVNNVQQTGQVTPTANNGQQIIPVTPPVTNTAPVKNTVTLHH